MVTAALFAILAQAPLDETHVSERAPAATTRMKSLIVFGAVTAVSGYALGAFAWRVSFAFCGGFLGPCPTTGVWPLLPVIGSWFTALDRNVLDQNLKITAVAASLVQLAGLGAILAGSFIELPASLAVTPTPNGAALAGTF